MVESECLSLCFEHLVVFPAIASVLQDLGTEAMDGVYAMAHRTQAGLSILLQQNRSDGVGKRSFIAWMKNLMGFGLTQV